MLFNHFSCSCALVLLIDLPHCIYTHVLLSMYLTEGGKCGGGGGYGGVVSVEGRGVVGVKGGACEGVEGWWVWRGMGVEGWWVWRDGGYGEVVGVEGWWV